MLALVRRARRRWFRNELLSQGANAFSAALAAFILLLLLGTQIFDWHWAVLIPLAAVVAGLYRALRQLPSPYAVAQLVDRRLALADTLSTAIFFSEPAAPSHGSPEVRRAQFERAQRLSESIDLRKAVPYAMPRSVYALGALILVASSLFALRYGLSRRLDLRPPLARILQQTFGNSVPPEQAKDIRRAPPKNPDSQDEMASLPSDREKGAGQAGDAQEDSLEPSNQSNADQASAAGSKDGSKKQAQDGEKAGGDQQDQEGQDRADANQGDNAGAGQKNSGKSRQNQQAAARQESGSGENSSLLSKVKDAVQNLLSSMKPQPGNSGAQQQSAMDQNGKQGKGQPSGGKQQAGKDGKQQSGGQQGEAQEGEPGDNARNAENSQGKGTGKSDSQQASKQPGSGIGSQDGSKEIKQAEQLAAMGKISEIIGKRSATLTGEATVEVQSTSQQLHTPYAQRLAQHTQGGTEISRDEIPVALQAYVEQYFEQVRKPAPPKK